MHFFSVCRETEIFFFSLDVNATCLGHFESYCHFFVENKGKKQKKWCVTKY